MSQTVLVFRDKATADVILHEIAVTPFGLVWVWFDPDDPATNRVQYAQGADGRCAIAHPWSEVDRDWLEAYLADWVASGDVRVLDALPEDWPYLQIEN